MNIVLLESLGISDAYLNELTAPLIAAGHSFTACKPSHIDSETIEMAKDADILVLGNKPLPDGVIRALPRLKYISVAFTGVDHIGLAACKEQNIAVSNCAGYATDAVAELTVGAMVALLRRVLECDDAVRTGGTREGLIGCTLKGKTVGIVGTGAIGLRVAELLQPFGCELIAYAPREKARAKELGIRYLPLEEVVKTADILTLHTPLTDETRGMIGAAQIAAMKPGAYFINMARAQVADSYALAAALKKGALAGAAIDVFEKEPPIHAGHPLLGAPRVLLMPHIGFATKESLELRAKMAFENVAAYLAGEQLHKIL